MRRRFLLLTGLLALSMSVMASAADPAPVNINTASAAELRTLKGIGPARAAAIIRSRPFDTIDQLESRKVLPPAIVRAIRSRLAL